MTISVADNWEHSKLHLMSAVKKLLTTNSTIYLELHAETYLR